MAIFALFYGLLTSFVLSGSASNRRAGTANPAIMNWTALVLMGFSMGMCGFLLYAAVSGMQVEGVTDLLA